MATQPEPFVEPPALAPPSTPGQPVPHAAGPANSAPSPSSTPGQAVQSWVIPTLP